jgi:hypothetical protein
VFCLLGVGPRPGARKSSGSPRGAPSNSHRAPTRPEEAQRPSLPKIPLGDSTIDGTCRGGAWVRVFWWVGIHPSSPFVATLFSTRPLTPDGHVEPDCPLSHCFDPFCREMPRLSVLLLAVVAAVLSLGAYGFMVKPPMTTSGKQLQTTTGEHWAIQSGCGPFRVWKFVSVRRP